MNIKGRGRGVAFGAATVVNAMPSGRGAAFGVRLRTFAEVTLKDDPAVDVEIEAELARSATGRAMASLGMNVRASVRAMISGWRSSHSRRRLGASAST